MNQIRTLDGLSDSQSEQRTNQNQERFDPVRIQLRNEVNIGYWIRIGKIWIIPGKRSDDYGPGNFDKTIQYLCTVLMHSTNVQY